ncbi:hypothetical protein N9O24_00635 [bacterium]|nr:hypothetical protein [bacterium]
MNVNYTTTYFAFVHRAPAREVSGKTFLILGAAGGVGLASIQVGINLGACIVACASSRSKLNICLEYGSAYAVDYT